MSPRALAASSHDDKSAWQALPPAARVYIIGVIAAGAYLMVAFFPASLPRPVTLATLLVVSCLTSLWKVKLLLSPKSDSTLSVSYAADLTALLLLGPEAAMVVAVAGAWTQCTFRVKQRYPPHRTIFSMAAEAITIQATGLAYAGLGGLPEPTQFVTLPKPAVGAISTYFLVNTGLVAGAIALSSRQPFSKVWHDNFLWSGPSFMVAGAAGALAAVVVGRGEYWLAILLLAPVYLTYRTYGVFLGRIEDQQRHVEEARRLHAEAVEALSLARRTERALAVETERLSVTLRSIGDGVITTDLQGHVQLVNHAAETLTGWTQEEALGLSLSRVFQSLDRETREPCEALADFSHNPDKPGLTRCTLLVARDLTERPIEEMAAPLRDATGRTIGMVLAFRDISDALKMQAERARADKLASLGLLAGGIAHDFNNILMAVMGNVSIARMMAATGPAVTALADAEQACVRARQLTWQLLTFSKGGVPVKKIMTLPRLLEEAAALALRGSNARCRFDFGPDLWPVQADDTQLVQVFNNILVNAQQAMAQGGTIVIRAENIVEHEHRWDYALRAEPGSYVRVSIVDEGVGIPQENLASIFDPYFTTKLTHSGLGLATSHTIIKNHGGFVSVDSALGRGTTVHVHLPAALDCDVEDTAGAGLIESAGGGSRILVMDDDASIRTLAASMLEFLGYKAETVTSGTAAVERYRRALVKGRPFDAVIVDLVMPEGMGGKETMERISQMDQKANVILVSGYAHHSMTADFQKLGFKAFIPKPFTLDELSRTLQSVVTTWSQRVH